MIVFVIGVSRDLVTIAPSFLLVHCFVSCELFLVVFIVACMFAYAWCLLRVEREPFVSVEDQKVMTGS
jgi:hypothetical protein